MELQSILRCPLDPQRQATLIQERDQLVCQCCQVKFPIKNSIPILIAEEAQLPAEFPSLPALPCQRQKQHPKR